MDIFWNHPIITSDYHELSYDHPILLFNNFKVVVTFKEVFSLDSSCPSCSPFPLLFISNSANYTISRQTQHIKLIAKKIK